MIVGHRTVNEPSGIQPVHFSFRPRIVGKAVFLASNLSRNIYYVFACFVKNTSFVYVFPGELNLQIHSNTNVT